MALDKKYGRIDIPKIDADEPVFILRAKDIVAHAAILDYAERCGLHGSPPAHVQAVIDAAKAFAEWPNENKKIPD